MTTTVSNLESEGLPDPTGHPDEMDRGKVEGKSPTRLAIERFRKDRLSMVSFIIVALYILGGILAPFLVKFGLLDPTSYHQDLLNEFTLPEGPLGGISWKHPLGVEPGTGRDVMSRVWLGTTLSLTIALIASLLAMAIGTVLGIIAGFTGGLTDGVIGRLIDLTLSFPSTLMLLALSAPMYALLTKNFHVPEGDLAWATYVVVFLAIFGWPPIARLIRGQVLSIREREFVHAATLFGASRFRMYFKEILPNLWAPLLVSFTLLLPAYISAEAALSYLGVSIKPPTPTLGNVLRDSLNYAEFDFVYFFSPAFAIALIVVCFNLLGDGLRDALDPKSNR
ncbi:MULTISPECIES: ABC transporter permease [unclassified Nocardioides]|uniref:ABC transporter permease n=1 Tax=unclassified Nocardioides TaxID=2615069 RepID=UPI0006F852F4|nr:MULTISPECIES: ABC transporter permease [unclassified Nocardioides]KRA32669.1 peptide ABC transporter permease [Nocardioides sp. Root614]KRA89322.1 peptide ABC transporter permease [Nocardioides sp. Root682]